MIFLNSINICNFMLILNNLTFHLNPSSTLLNWFSTITFWSTFTACSWRTWTSIMFNFCLLLILNFQFRFLFNRTGYNRFSFILLCHFLLTFRFWFCQLVIYFCEKLVMIDFFFIICFIWHFFIFIFDIIYRWLWRLTSSFNLYWLTTVCLLSRRFVATVLTNLFIEVFCYHSQI